MNTIEQLPVSRLLPHPDNPRKDLGDLTELTESVRSQGILQNLTVVSADQVLGVQKYCSRCGATFLEREEQNFCPACRVARRKRAQRKWARTHNERSA
jgi:exosome complex RNA-binding protein Csl4